MKYEYEFKVRDNSYYLIFSDGLVLEKEIQNPNALDYNTEVPRVITNFKRPDNRWVYFALFSNGKIEKYEVNRCKCLLPKEFQGMSPTDYEMYVLLFNNWVKKGKLTYSSENKDDLEAVVKQFDKKGRWLDDLNYHRFICNECADELIISINTYRGGGGLERKEKNRS